MRRPKDILWADHQDMGEEFRLLRSRRGLRLVDLAELSGFTCAGICKIERGRSLPKLYCWLRLAQILCQTQSEYSELRKYFLGALMAEDADYKYVPKSIENLIEIDTYSFDIPRGVLGFN